MYLEIPISIFIVRLSGPNNKILLIQEFQECTLQFSLYKLIQSDMQLQKVYNLKRKNQIIVQSEIQPKSNIFPFNIQINKNIMMIDINFNNNLLNQYVFLFQSFYLGSQGWNNNSNIIFKLYYLFSIYILTFSNNTLTRLIKFIEMISFLVYFLYFVRVKKILNYYLIQIFLNQYQDPIKIKFHTRVVQFFYAQQEFYKASNRQENRQLKWKGTFDHTQCEQKMLCLKIEIIYIQICNPLIQQIMGSCVGQIIFKGNNQIKQISRFPRLFCLQKCMREQYRQCKVQRKLIKLNREVENGFEQQFIPKKINKKQQ
ncbi:unnamed protein product [Paramecium sonneborni]|uniref:Uncharacterized protein n=1 Tax=Paramecium sonneborni TaxID=65129 RepID=A0A8S1RVD9_9CILI|nr:unnamed protein product [Paramecium sonneborni]